LTPRQLAALLKQMEEQDKGRAAPHLPGPYGTFLVRYGRERNDVVKLALTHRIAIRRDGAISGRDLQHITVIPLFPDEAAGEVETHWGRLAIFLALCPELMSLLSVRLWLESASARDAYRGLLAGYSSGIRIHGDFRWLPPTAITAGTAEFETVTVPVGDSWTGAPYLKTTADDIFDIPHALDYSSIILGGRGLLAQFRSFIVRCSNMGRVVPGGIRPKAVALRAKDLPNSGNASVATVLCLAYREPGESEWTIWKTVPVDPSLALEHNLRWVAYMRGLAGEQPLTTEIATACRDAIGTDLPLPDVANPRWQLPVLPEPRLNAFAKDVSARLRLGNRR